MQGKASIEVLVHFNCGYCGLWWSIGDAPPEKTDWFCPWCGQRQIIYVPLFPAEIQPQPTLSVQGDSNP